MYKKSKFNLILMWFYSTFVAISTSLASVSVLSAYFLRGGMTEAQVSFYLSFTQIVNLVISLLLSGITSGYRDSRKISSILHFLCGISTGLFAIFCFWQVESGIFYVMMLLIGGLQAMATAVRLIFEYKMPCEIIVMEHYSLFVAYQSLFGGIMGMLIATFLPPLFQRFDFMHTTGGICIAAALCYGFSGTLIRFLRPITSEPAENTEPTQRLSVHPVQGFIRLMKNRDFRYLLMPNLIRGFGAGLVSMIAVIAMRGLNMSDADVSWITAATYLGTLLSCFVYTFLVKRVGLPWTGLVGSFLFCLLCGSMTGGTLQFLIIYTIAYVGYNVVCNAVPDMVYHSVSQDIISSFHTWRLALTTLGTAVSTALFGVMLTVVDPAVLMLLGCVGILVCSLGYYFYYRKTLAPKKRNS